MILTRHNTAIFLVNNGLLDTRSLMEQPIAIRSHSQRNRGFSVTWPSGQGYYVKQHQPDAGPWEKRSSVAHEAEVLQRLNEQPGLHDCVPTLRFYDVHRQALVVDWLTPAHGAHEVAINNGVPDLQVANQLGQTLARLHQGLTDIACDDLPGNVPWVIRLDRLYPLAGEDQSWGQARLVALVQSRQECMAALDALALTWPRSQLIHGDMKWQNCLLQGEYCVFIDWEMADRGDPLWDLAGLCQSWLKNWMDRQPWMADGDDAVAQAAEDFGPYQRALAQVWRSYQPVPAPGAERLMALCGARLLQTLYEDLVDETELSATHTLLLQLARNLLVAPQLAAQQWLEVV
ncbi:phosphotransferase [Pseudomonas sp. CCM 7893]|uniref:Phosphotransferase n=1 Tax=Pseudomonas spelaei TaxID=1055469 RepID=A0A6I3WH42_9PSED|nr:aminoglycoside phosphotransferase family protein [Pseudomonas spelaei]MUF06472.1 phosphotransferase [Pseudomonas spelaei]